MMLLKCFSFAVLAVVVCARTTATNQNSIQDEARSEDSTSYYGDLKFLYKVYQECAQSDLSSCLKMKLVTALDRMAKSYSDVSIFDGVSFVKNANAPTIETKNEKEIEANLPRSLDEKDNALNSMITDRVSNFFETHTLQVKLPSITDMSRSFTDEARKKKKGGGAYMILPLILGGTLIPLALGALALLAGKALIVSKLALVLAGIIGLKKLLGGGGGHGSEQVVVGGHSSGWGRSYQKEEEAQKLAYSAYAQKSR